MDGGRGGEEGNPFLMSCVACPSFLPFLHDSWKGRWVRALTVLLRLPQVTACMARQHPNSKQEAGLDHPSSCRPSTEKLVMFTA